VERTSRQRGEGYVNLALLTDGLRAEREQNITIDVAYRYFATPKRRFIIADTPGHVQYTRNMVTGASTAELAIVLVDARKGVLTQSRRHGFITSLLGIPHLVVAVNKMDLVGYAEEVYERIAAEYRAFAEKLEVRDLTCIPISALAGDNVVKKGEAMPWYEGGTLLHHLETVNVGVRHNLIDFRLPVQYVVRPHQDYRGFVGRVASGTLQPGEEVVVLPSGTASRVRSIDTPEGALEEAVAGDSVVVTLEDEVDVSRGGADAGRAGVAPAPVAQHQTAESRGRDLLAGRHPARNRPPGIRPFCYVECIKECKLRGLSPPTCVPGDAERDRLRAPERLSRPRGGRYGGRHC
jgi:bifunctional enzyme CysN/CysC